MKKVLSFAVLLVLMVSFLGGCSNSASKTYEAVKNSQINQVKSNQDMVKMVIEREYVEFHTVPTDEKINSSMPKTLSELQISVVRNDDGTVNICNTNPQISKEEAPDLIWKP